MFIDYNLLGKRISYFRNKSNLSQDELSEQVNLSRPHLGSIESGAKRPSLDTLVAIANTLRVSPDDLLVDSLSCSHSASDTRLHQLLLDCNKGEEDIILRNAENLRALLYSHDVK